MNGEKHGHGVMIFSNGEKYQGEFKYGEMDGKGVYVTLNLKTRHGPMVDAMKDFGNNLRWTGKAF